MNKKWYLMKTAINYKEDLINLTRELPSNKVKALGFSYKKIPHSAEYIRKMRAEDGKKSEIQQKLCRRTS